MKRLYYLVVADMANYFYIQSHQREIFFELIVFSVIVKMEFDTNMSSNVCNVTYPIDTLYRLLTKLSGLTKTV